MSTLIADCDSYLQSRTGKYEWRRIRYRAAIDAMWLSDDMTIVDVGAGWTEFDYTLRAEENWRGRYYPVDGGLDGSDLNNWTPPRTADWFVALEIIEHVYDPSRLIHSLQMNAQRGVILSTPNPARTDVLAMDATHVTVCPAEFLESMGFGVEERSFYGKEADSLFAWWYVGMGTPNWAK